MRTLDEIGADADDRMPFSNGEEGYGWMANWCARCKNDSPELIDKGEGCRLILVGMLGKTPKEWLDQTQHDEQGRMKPYSIADQYHCVEFRDQDEPGGEEPTPIPDPPGQETLFGREPVEGVRMFADVLAGQSAVSA
jgi:hypothetical protein